MLRLMAILFGSGLLTSIIDYVLLLNIPLTGPMTEGTIPELVRMAVYFVIWGTYFMRSKRVANTFVR
ncbi:DUF2569 family protein [Paenibacillus tengchongensis]|uniref:DUF2569 family protein n=1 Tax=Paenibacillus tengchongensis TaxID=2608684 RepID=UPI00124E9115|nr:DUF2569 family protein [Paenibacillus tengchongensis]